MWLVYGVGVVVAELMDYLADLVMVAVGERVADDGFQTGTLDRQLLVSGYSLMWCMSIL